MSEDLLVSENEVVEWETLDEGHSLTAEDNVLYAETYCDVFDVVAIATESKPARLLALAVKTARAYFKLAGVAYRERNPPTAEELAVFQRRFERGLEKVYEDEMRRLREEGS